MTLEKRDTKSSIQRLLRLRERVDELNNELHEEDYQPKIDMLDLGNAYKVIVEVPGVAQADLEVGVHGRQLTIAGLREGHQDTPEVLMRERPSGHFQRSISLPGDVERERSSAQLAEGLLILTLPKA